jgi:type II secretory pathway pseudopilin PulG
MFLKKKKLRGMSLVELLAYTVILSIVTTALFQLIHFIQKMNDDLIKQQEIYSEFNIAILKLDNFISGNLNSQDRISVSDYCINDGNESFYFSNDGALCNDKACPSQENRKNCTNPITKPIFKVENKFFEDKPAEVNNLQEISYNFSVLNYSDLNTSGIYSFRNVK